MAPPRQPTRVQLEPAPALRAQAAAIWQAGVAAVRPETLIPRGVRVEADALHLADQVLPLASIRSLAVVGAGKAAAAMARAFEIALGPDLAHAKNLRGLVNVIDDFAEPGRPGIAFHAARPAGDPSPTEAGVDGSAAMLDLVRALGPDDVAVCLLSGGASALLPLPADGVTLAEKREATALLSRAGAPIADLNTVRKHLSRVKGGQLAAACGAGRLVSLILSDVIGNPLDIIASGPTAPDPSTFAEALAVIRRHDLTARMPPAVMRHLEAGAAGRIPETLKSLPGTVINRIIGDNGTAVRAAAAEAERLGFAVEILPAPLEGEARDAGRRLARLALARREGRAGRPLCILAGGETVVSRVPPGGRGGRCQEMALGAFTETAAAGFAGCCLLAAGTDGEDGPTDAAGAFYDEPLRRAARARRLDAAAYFLAGRSYDFFAPTGGLFKTGPTGTNVMDLAVLLIG